MSTPARVAEARLALARRLAMLRDAGFSQAQTARRIRYSRSAVARAEATGVAAATFAA
jgi:transcriptional regulator with XRE-family HTH domain